jgi:hypothetical protein
VKSPQSHYVSPVPPASHEEATSWPTTAEIVILGTFGVDLSHQPSAEQIRKALTAAGFRPLEARHILRNSPLLQRTDSGTYLLRPALV